ncbi:MAG: AMP-binding protein [Acidimicrobiales bacterium]|jgi:long-chain acyl-CoA synthetase|nr:AMP-binding protein [Acidimicrobiales bacterium]
MPTFEDACASLTAPGQPLELADTEIRGRTYPVFVNAQPDLATAFAAVAEVRGDQEYLVYEDEHWTYGEVVAHGHALAAALVEEYGIAKGDRVAIAMRNYPEWITAVVGIAAAGAVSVPLNAWWEADELAYGLSDSGSKVVIVDEERLARIAEPVGRGEVHAIVVRSDARGGDAARYDQVVKPRRAAPDVDIDPDDDATIMYTSGTTGAAKGAVHTHRNHCQAIMAFACRALVGNALEKDRAAAEGTTPEPGPGRACFVLAVPLFHITGFVPVMLGTFFHGNKLVMMYKWDARKALEHVEAEGVTNFVGVPTMVQDLLEVPDFDSFDTSSLRQVGGGGGPAAPEMVRRVESTFSRGRPGLGYGMTETTAYGPQNSSDDYVARPTSTGRSVPVMQLKVVDDGGNELPLGEQGEICFYGPTVIREYWNKPDATADAFYDGWLRSGDLGRIDDEGFVYVEDRAKDMVIRAGENIGCIEVESAIAEHPAVYENTVFGLPHERLGEELACAIYLKDGASLDGDELRSFLTSRLASFKIPTVVDIRDDMLPRSPQGKILKRVVRDELAALRAG